MRDDPEIQQILSRYHLGLPKLPAAGRSGELLGRGTGSSVEFQEFREYTPGDDIRHLDWSSYARSDTLMVRLFREEISPRTEILMDASKSMATHGESKSRVTRQLASLFTQFVGRLGGRPKLYVMGDEYPIEPMSVESLEHLGSMPFDSVSTIPEHLEKGAISFQPQSVRIVISDFLFPHDPARLIRKLATNAAALWVVQVLNGWELNPEMNGGRRFVDVESGEELDVMINKQVIQDYLRRLKHLQNELVVNCQRNHARFVTLNSDQGLPNLCKDQLCAAGMLRTD